VRESEEMGMNNPEENRERWMVLTDLVAKVQDTMRLLALISEVNELLDEDEDELLSEDFALLQESRPS
jgi:hypothetical protein